MTRQSRFRARRFVFLLLVGLLFPLDAEAEAILGLVRAVVDAGQDAGRTLLLPTSQFVALVRPADRIFTTAVDIEVEVPADIRGTRNAVGLFVYSRVSPEPASGPGAATRHDGTMELVLPLGGSGLERLTVVVPGSPPGANDPSTSRLLDLRDESAFPLLVGVAPISKGLADALLNLEYRITLRRRTIPEGGVRVRVHDTQGVALAPDTMRVYLGPSRPIDPGAVELIAPGLHTIRVESDDFVPQERTVGVQRGTITEVVFELEAPQPQVVVEAPRSAVVTIDGRLVRTGEALFLPAGEHTVVFRIDDFTVSRRFHVSERRRYTISLFLDILVQED